MNWVVRASLVVLVGLVPTAAASAAPDELSPLPSQPGSLKAQLLETLAPHERRELRWLGGVEPL
jgi:hypothetical protein